MIEPGEAVMVTSGKLHGAILTYVRESPFGHVVIFNRMETTVPAVRAKERCPGCGCMEWLNPVFCMDLCNDCMKGYAAPWERERPENLIYAENPPL
jgi:hypothetical protein